MKSIRTLATFFLGERMQGDRVKPQFNLNRRGAGRGAVTGSPRHQGV